MRYGITADTLEERPFLELSKDEYARLTAAQGKAMLVLRIEEKFDAVLQNYLEFERDVVTLAIDHAVFQELDWTAVIGKVHTINRRLANVLTLARMYIEQTQSEVADVADGATRVRTQLLEAFQAAYDQSLGYRVMEALRNHVQHYAFPIGALSY